MPDSKTIVNEMNVIESSLKDAKVAASDVTKIKIEDKAVSYNGLNFTKVYSKDHTFSSGARSGFNYSDFMTKEQFIQPLKWKWMVTILDIEGPNKNIYVRNCSHLDVTGETGVFWFEYYYFSSGVYLPGVQVDNRAGAPVSVRVELYRWD